MTSDPDLSPAGVDRRDYIGRLAVRAAVGRGRRRRAGRAVGGLAVIALVVVAVRPHRQTVRPPVVICPRAPALSPPSVGVAVTFVPTDPTIVDRLRVDPAPRWRTIGDRELLDALAAAGRPAGLVRTDDGRVVLVEP